MQFIHRISVAATSEIRAELASMAIPVGPDGLATFEMDESHQSWSAMREWIVRRGAVDVVATKFSKSEIAGARWLELMPDWHCGYPQPNEDVFGYWAATYDLSEFCALCGIGAKQKAPFQMKGEPKWGRRSILQLNWVFDEFFVTPEVWAKTFEPHGVGKRQVLRVDGTELRTVVQLVVESEVDIVIGALQWESCPSCGRIKYVPLMRGPFPALADEPSGEMAKTRQYFGSGVSASKRVLISQKLARVLDRQKLQGASVRPVAAPYDAVQTARPTTP